MKEINDSIAIKINSHRVILFSLNDSLPLAILHAIYNVWIWFSTNLPFDYKRIYYDGVQGEPPCNSVSLKKEEKNCNKMMTEFYLVFTLGDENFSIGSFDSFFLSFSLCP